MQPQSQSLQPSPAAEQVIISEDLQFAVRLVDAINNHQPHHPIKPIRTLVEIGGTNGYQWYVDNTGKTPLHHAAMKGHLDIVKLLLEAGHPWNCQDDSGKTPAEYSSGIGSDIYEYLLAEAVRSEMLLSLVETKELASGMDCDDDPTPTLGNGDGNVGVGEMVEGKMEYLDRNIAYVANDELLQDEMGNAVMMEWERPLMRKHAEIICQLEMESDWLASIRQQCPSIIDRLHLSQYLADGFKSLPTANGSYNQHQPYCVLNVGFGLGIVDSYIHACLMRRAQLEPNRRFIHYIIEAHPSVHAKMDQSNWVTSAGNSQSGMPELVVIKEQWQTAVSQLLANGVQFDGIFFDTFGEDYKALQQWHEEVGNLLNPTGLYSYFNGLGGRNSFFNHVYSQIVELELADMGLETAWINVPMGQLDYLEVKDKYFTLDIYRLPTCRFMQY